MSVPSSKVGKPDIFDPLNNISINVLEPLLVTPHDIRKQFLYSSMYKPQAQTDLSIEITKWGYSGGEGKNASSSNWYIYDKPFPDPKLSGEESSSEESSSGDSSSEDSSSEDSTVETDVPGNPHRSCLLPTSRQEKESKMADTGLKLTVTGTISNPEESYAYYCKDKILEPGNAYFTGSHNCQEYFPGYWTYCKCNMKYDPDIVHNGEVLIASSPITGTTPRSVHLFEMVDKQLLEYEQKMLGPYLKIKRIMVIQSVYHINNFYRQYMSLLMKKGGQTAIPVISTYHHVPFTPKSRNYKNMLLNGMDKQMDSHLINSNSLMFKDTASTTHKYNVPDKDGVYRMLKCQICPGEYSVMTSGCLTNMLFRSRHDENDGLLINYEKTGYNPDGNNTWLINNPELVYMDYVIEYTVSTDKCEQNGPVSTDKCEQNGPVSTELVSEDPVTIKEEHASIIPPPEVVSFTSIYIQIAEELLFTESHTTLVYDSTTLYTILSETIVKVRQFIFVCGDDIVKQPLPQSFTYKPEVLALFKKMRYHCVLLAKYEPYKSIPSTLNSKPTSSGREFSGMAVPLAWDCNPMPTVPARKISDAMQAEINTICHIFEYHHVLEKEYMYTSKYKTVNMMILNKLITHAITHYSQQIDRYISWLTSLT